MAYSHKDRTSAFASRQRLHRVFLVILLLCTIIACSSGSSGGAPPAVEGGLAGAELLGSLDAAALNVFLAELGLQDVTASGIVACYRLTYWTPDVAAALVTASGLVCLPQPRSGGNPVLSYQHGTIFQDPEAPSSILTSNEGKLGAAFAALGYIAVLPDFIGYGASTNALHPYVHAGTLASTTVNMNRAARSFLAQRGIAPTGNGKFFLTGYSEGGYATLAAQKLMEQTLAAEFPITASEPGAGPYDLTGTSRTLLSSPTQTQPAFTGFFIKAYDAIYNAPSELTRYFTAGYASVVDTHFDGSFSRNQIRDALGGAGVATNALFDPAFLASFLNAGEAALKADIAANDIYNWAPTVPTRLFHGVDDDIVPYANSSTAAAAMSANGSTTVTVVDCITIGVPANHENCAAPFARDVIQSFQGLSGL